MASRIVTWFKFLSGNSTRQHKGSQSTQPESSAHENTPLVTIDSALQVSTVWACVTLITENISSLPLFVYTVDDKNNRVIDKNLRIYKILHDSPNKRQTSLEFWEQMLLNYLLRGNAYAKIERDSSGELLSLWPLASDQMEVIVSEDARLVYVYTIDNQSIAYDEDQILHIRGMGNGIVGLSPLEYMQSSVGTAISVQNHTSKTYSKNARRPGLLMSDDMFTPEQRAAVKKNFGDIVEGKSKELYVLEARLKFEPLGMTPADLQMLETRKFAVQDLARWFGVPSVLINDTSESTSLGSSVQQIVDGFHKLKLRPLLERIEQVLNQRVLTPGQRAKGMIVEFNFDALLRASLAERMEIYSTAVQNGIFDRNEARSRENMPTREGGDVLTAQSNLMPLDKLGQQTASGSVPEEPIQQ